MAGDFLTDFKSVDEYVNRIYFDIRNDRRPRLIKNYRVSEI